MLSDRQPEKLYMNSFHMYESGELPISGRSQITLNDPTQGGWGVVVKNSVCYRCKTIFLRLKRRQHEDDNKFLSVYLQ